MSSISVLPKFLTDSRPHFPSFYDRVVLVLLLHTCPDQFLSIDPKQLRDSFLQNALQCDRYQLLVLNLLWKITNRDRSKPDLRNCKLSRIELWGKYQQLFRTVLDEPKAATYRCTDDGFAAFRHLCRETHLTTDYETYVAWSYELSQTLPVLGAGLPQWCNINTMNSEQIAVLSRVRISDEQYVAVKLYAKLLSGTENSKLWKAYWEQRAIKSAVETPAEHPKYHPSPSLGPLLTPDPNWPFKLEAEATPAEHITVKRDRPRRQGRPPKYHPPPSLGSLPELTPDPNWPFKPEAEAAPAENITVKRYRPRRQGRHPKYHWPFKLEAEETGTERGSIKLERTDSPFKLEAEGTRTEQIILGTHARLIPWRHVYKTTRARSCVSGILHAVNQIVRKPQWTAFPTFGNRVYAGLQRWLGTSWIGRRKREGGSTLIGV